MTPRISTAMTPGGGVAGIGFDGTGFGEEVAALISTQKVTIRAATSERTLGGQQDDRSTKSMGGVLEDPWLWRYPESR